MQWFGRKRAELIYTDCPEAARPEGATCRWCGEAIGSADDGFLIPLLGGQGHELAAYHRECHLRAIFGGVNHQLGSCTCCGGTEPPDDPELSAREAAVAAVVMYGGWRMFDAGGNPH